MYCHGLAHRLGRGLGLHYAVFSTSFENLAEIGLKTFPLPKGIQVEFSLSLISCPDNRFAKFFSTLTTLQEEFQQTLSAYNYKRQQDTGFAAELSFCNRPFLCLKNEILFLTFAHFGSIVVKISSGGATMLIMMNRINNPNPMQSGSVNAVWHGIGLTLSYPYREK